MGTGRLADRPPCTASPAPSRGRRGSGLTRGAGVSPSRQSARRRSPLPEANPPWCRPGRVSVAPEEGCPSWSAPLPRICGSAVSSCRARRGTKAWAAARPRRRGSIARDRRRVEAPVPRARPRVRSRQQTPQVERGLVDVGAKLLRLRGRASDRVGASPAVLPAQRSEPDGQLPRLEALQPVLLRVRTGGELSAPDGQPGVVEASGTYKKRGSGFAFWEGRCSSRRTRAASGRLHTLG